MTKITHRLRKVHQANYRKLSTKGVKTRLIVFLIEPQAGDLLNSGCHQSTALPAHFPLEMWNTNVHMLTTTDEIKNAKLVVTFVTHYSLFVVV